MKPHRTHAPRRSRRQERQEGAVLLLVLMVVAISTLGATFAVQDTTTALGATRGAQVAMTTRYAAETGANVLPRLLSKMPAEALQLDLIRNGNLARTTADGGTAGFPSARLHIPVPSGEAFKLITSVDVASMLYADAGVPGSVVTQNQRTPDSVIFENVVESQRGNSRYHYTISTYGRSTHAWNPDAGTYVTGGDFQQAGDDNFYHDTVSVARAYYTAPINL